MSTRVRADAQKFTHLNSTLSTTASTVTLPAHTSKVWVQNVDASIVESISFDGTNYYQVPAETTFVFDCDSILSFKIKAASGTPSVQILAASEA